MFINHYMLWFSDNEGRVLAAGGKRALFGVQAGSGGSVIAVRRGGRSAGVGERRRRASLIRDRHAKGPAMRQRRLRSRMETE